jgi:hypothetical protein
MSFPSCPPDVAPVNVPSVLAACEKAGLLSRAMGCAPPPTEAALLTAPVSRTKSVCRRPSGGPAILRLAKDLIEDQPNLKAATVAKLAGEEASILNHMLKQGFKLVGMCEGDTCPAEDYKHPASEMDVTALHVHADLYPGTDSGLLSEVVVPQDSLSFHAGDLVLAASVRNVCTRIAVALKDLFHSLTVFAYKKTGEQLHLFLGYPCDKCGGVAHRDLSGVVGEFWGACHCAACGNDLCTKCVEIDIVGGTLTSSRKKCPSCKYCIPYDPDESDDSDGASVALADLGGWVSDGVCSRKQLRADEEAFDAKKRALKKRRDREDAELASEGAALKHRAFEALSGDTAFI